MAYLSVEGACLQRTAGVLCEGIEGSLIEPRNGEHCGEVRQPLNPNSRPVLSHRLKPGHL